MAALTVLLALGPSAHADPERAYVSEFVPCVLAMGTLQIVHSADGCTFPLGAGTFHVDVDVVYLGSAEFTVTVRSLAGGFLSVTCSTRWRPFEGSLACGGSGDGQLDAESGVGFGSFDGNAWFPVTLPAGGQVALDAGPGEGLLTMRGRSMQ